MAKKAKAEKVESAAVQPVGEQKRKMKTMYDNRGKEIPQNVYLKMVKGEPVEAPKDKTPEE